MEVPLKTIVIAGAPACGKTSLLKNLILRVINDTVPSVCKIDCIQSDDGAFFRKMGIASVQGLSESICPDHFLATNFLDIVDWSVEKKATHLYIETAGLCSRCAPFTELTLNICVVDALSSMKAPGKLGPMLTTADVLVITKIDMVSQSEREVLLIHLRSLNNDAAVFEINGITGYGIGRLSKFILENVGAVDSFEGDRLIHEMPSANCAYCVGETRIGRNFQQGMVQRMIFEKE